MSVIIRFGGGVSYKVIMIHTEEAHGTLFCPGVFCWRWLANLGQSRHWPFSYKVSSTHTYLSLSSHSSRKCPHPVQWIYQNLTPSFLVKISWSLQQPWHLQLSQIWTFFSRHTLLIKRLLLAVCVHLLIVNVSLLLLTKEAPDRSLLLTARHLFWKTMTSSLAWPVTMVLYQGPHLP